MRIIVVFLSLILSAKVFASVPVDPYLIKCSPYPEIKDNTSLPAKFNPTNNLARSAENSFYKAEGQKIVIYGRLMDANCVPINDGKIFIWQANKAGYIQYETKHKHKAKWMDPNFTGTGVTNSDNLGRFNFISIMPGSIGKTTAHINFRIEHPILKNFASKIYFLREGESIINDHHVSKHLKQEKIIAVPGGVDKDGVQIYFIDITLKQKIPYKEY